MVALVISLWIIRNQRQTIGQLRDKDLKYYYIKIQGNITTQDIDNKELEAERLKQEADNLKQIR